VAQDGELLLHDRLLLRGVEEAHGLVHVAVGANLVPSVADPLGLRQVMLDRPAGDVEARAELQTVEQSEDPVHADPRAEAARLEVAQAPPGLLWLAEENPRLGVEVEGQHDGALLSGRPVIAHGQPVTQPPLGWRICPVRYPASSAASTSAA